ncbi:MAG: DinB family protein [Candidatus Dormibacteria bacterium]
MIDGVDSMGELFRHNRWANARVFKVCLAADPSLVTAEARGTFQSIDASLRHLVAVEEGFGGVISEVSGSDALPVPPTFMVSATGMADGYMEHELAWYAERAAYLDSFYCELVGGITQVGLGREVKVPWLTFSTTVAEALTQVLVHSGHHRSQAFSALGERGVKVPDLDYVVMLARERATQ